MCRRRTFLSCPNVYTTTGKRHGKWLKERRKGSVKRGFVCIFPYPFVTFVLVGWRGKEKYLMSRALEMSRPADS